MPFNLFRLVIDHLKQGFDFVIDRLKVVNVKKKKGKPLKQLFKNLFNSLDMSRNDSLIANIFIVSCVLSIKSQFYFHTPRDAFLVDFQLSALKSNS